MDDCDAAAPNETDERIAALRRDAARLAADDRRLARAAALAGRFPIRLRPPGFGTLLGVILEQQVSTASARAMRARLDGVLPEPTPAGFLALDDATLKRCGFSRQKTVYGRALAEAIAAGRLDLAALAGESDEAAVAALSALKGIGRWTAENYLLWGLGRRDIFPAQDLALLVGWQWLTDSESRPRPEDLRGEAVAWQPRRTAAALLIWHFYLATMAARKAARGSGGTKSEIA
ncbi:MAG: DNA-3-methyladenine glycosylase 2 family protein [Alphaproteobacteria bacterium]|jgi:DNA-3-methyladenine glycosylase II|nr:DNA-3-methyladenine glycosylase 2 family protein [Alphaproteobacteria bacterium]